MISRTMAADTSGHTTRNLVVRGASDTMAAFAIGRARHDSGGYGLGGPGGSPPGSAVSPREAGWQG
jgi:hypothetical protein